MHIRKRHYSIATIVLLLTIGGIFTALGIAFTVIIIDGAIKTGLKDAGAGILMPIVLILALLGFGITALVFGGKDIYLWIRAVRTDKRGRDATAHIVNYKSASFSRKINTRRRYALVLLYKDGEKNKKFTTDYLFDVNEFRYLKKLKSVKIKIDGSFVTVCEQFPKEIYKLDSTYGIEVAFFKQKPVAILLRLWAVFFFLALAFFIVSMIVADGVYTEAAIITLFVIHFPFVIPMAVYLIKWFCRKK